MLLLFLSILPVVLLMIYFYYRDKYEKEPLSTLMLAFFGGILSAGATLAALYPFIGYFPQFESNLLNSIFTSLFLAAIPEEFFKFVFLFIFIWGNRNFNEYYDGIIYAVFVSLGFACIENIGYVFQHGIGTGIGRALLTVPAHALFGVIMGYYFAHAKFIPESRSYYLFRSVLYPIIAHTLFNFMLFYSSGLADSYPYGALIVFFLFLYFNFRLYKLALKKIRSHVDSSVFKPLPEDGEYV
jgi:RsiW-degrading membrane proteinase PrsW (M82 family)